MNVPTYPRPLRDKTGWPWTEETPIMPPNMPDGRPWPKISIVTPSYNQGKYLEETIRSVLLQNYPNLEYIIIDGGSSDESVDIIRKYERWLTYWVSEKDSGQAHAIAKGFDRATGDILNWLNSDDIFTNNALRYVAETFASHPHVGFVYGNRRLMDPVGTTIEYQYPPAWLTRFHFAIGQHVPQETCFWKTDIYRQAGGLDTSKFFAMDYDLFVRMWQVTPFKKIRRLLGCIRIHDDTKSHNHQEIMWREFEESKHAHSIPSFGKAGRFIVFRLARLQMFLEKRLSAS